MSKVAVTANSSGCWGIVNEKLLSSAKVATALLLLRNSFLETLPMTNTVRVSLLSLMSLMDTNCLFN